MDGVTAADRNIERLKNRVVHLDAINWIRTDEEGLPDHGMEVLIAPLISICFPGGKLCVANYSHDDGGWKIDGCLQSEPLTIIAWAEIPRFGWLLPGEAKALGIEEAETQQNTQFRT